MQFQQIRSATSIVTFGGKRFLIDPMLSTANTYPIVPDSPVCGQGNPTIELPCKPEDLFNVDAYIVTHRHFDHFDDRAIQILPKEIPLFAQNEEEAQKCQEAGFKNVRILNEEGLEFEGITLFKTPCDHGSSDTVTEHFYRLFDLTDKACGVVFKSSREKVIFYLAGDTVYYEGVIDSIKHFKPNVVAVNAAGAQAPKGHALIMNEYDVWALMTDFPDIEVIATHVEGVSHATVTRKSLAMFAENKNLKRLSIPADLEVLSF